MTIEWSVMWLSDAMKSKERENEFKWFIKVYVHNNDIIRAIIIK